MSENMKSYDVNRIGIFGHYGNNNLGDEAIIAATVQSLRRVRPDIVLYGFSLNPEGTKERHGLTSFPIRRTAKRYKKADFVAPKGSTAQPQPSKIRDLLKKIPLLRHLINFIRAFPSRLKKTFGEISFLFESMKYLDNVDMLMFTGSGQIFDGFGGPFGFPYTLYKWTFLCKLKRKKIAFVSVGAGPIHSDISKFFLFKSLLRADYFSYRDNYSDRLLKEKGFKKDAPIYPDLAVSLNFNLDEVKQNSGNKLIAINPIPYGDPKLWMLRDDKIYKNYLAKTAETASELLNKNYDVTFIPNNILVDNIVIDEISKILVKEYNITDENRLSRFKIDTIDSLLNSFNCCDLIISSRFHGILMSLLVPKPVIGLSYHPKTIDMMEYMGVKKYALDVEQFNAENILEMVSQIEDERDSLLSTITEKIGQHKESLEKQYRTILG